MRCQWRSERFSHLAIERLEERLALSINLEMIDVGRGPGTAESVQFVAAGGMLFFVANTGASGH
jgi:hypothetical protein